MDDRVSILVFVDSLATEKIADLEAIRHIPVSILVFVDSLATLSLRNFQG